MKILVTGGAGFIGSHIVDRYIELGHDVLVVDNLSTGKKENVNEKAKLIEVDITDKKAVKEAFKGRGIEVLNHHAAHVKVGESVENPQMDANVNVMGLLNVVEIVKDQGLKKIIFASSGGAMYGTNSLPFTEEMKPEPLSPYGVSKRVGELYLQYYYHEYGIDYLALRYANVYGPRQNPKSSGVIAIFSSMMLEEKAPIINGDGEQTRDYVYVKDVVRANELALESDYVGEVNIGTKREISVSEVYEAIARKVGLEEERKHGPAKPGEQRRSVLDASLAEEVLGWRPETRFEEGVVESLEWYKNAGR